MAETSRESLNSQAEQKRTARQAIVEPLLSWRTQRAGLPTPRFGQILRFTMRIAHCQFEPWVGDFEHSLARFEEGLKRADAEGAKIVSFPECFFTGYPDTEDEARRGAFATLTGQDGGRQIADRARKGGCF